MRPVRALATALIALLLLAPTAAAAEAGADPTAASTAAQPPTESTVPADSDGTEDQEQAVDKSFAERIDSAFGVVVGGMVEVLFWEVPFTTEPVVDEEGEPVLDDDGEPETQLKGIPLIILVLVAGGLFFTARYALVNLRLFGHAIACVRGKFDNPDDDGEVSHFKALTSALSATVGLGNIAGVAVAITAGGAGAVFWMWLVAFLGMSMKFTSCTFAQLYRRVKADGSVLGGPMVYLDEGLREKGLGPLGKVLAVLFSVLCIGASFGGGNMFQGNQAASSFSAAFFEQEFSNDEPATYDNLSLDQRVAVFVKDRDGNTTTVEAVVTALPTERDDGAPVEVRPEGQDVSIPIALTDVHKTLAPKIVYWLFGLLLAAVVGMVIIGGIKRIGQVTSKLVPVMCGFYSLVCIIIIFTALDKIPAIVGAIFTEAFTGPAMFGGFLGVLIQGMKRAAFSNEAGLGSAAIAHAAAKTKEPVREGLVAMLGPFIDTIVVCTMTALAILITDAHLGPDGNPTGMGGVEVTTEAFRSLGGGVHLILFLAVCVFAYSTMIAWGYYGERCSEYLFGEKGILPYRILYVTVVVFGPVMSLSNVLTFSDLMLLSMAFPNIIGMAILSPRIVALLKDYQQRLRSGEMHLSTDWRVHHPDDAKREDSGERP